MLNTVKLALRISHNYLDSDINATISTARLELSRSGVDLSETTTLDDLVKQAIKTYCLYVYASDQKLKEGYWESFQYQQDVLRKSSAYNGGDDDV